MKLTLNQQADHIELALQSQRDHVVRVLSPKVEKSQRSKEELKLAQLHETGLEAALSTMRFMAKHEASLRKLLDKQPQPDLLAAG